MRTLLRRLLLFVLGLVVLIALFYAEEDWRGKRAWENSKRELEARGEVLDWKAYIPPPMPDDQNFFKAPKMAEWFQKKPPGFTASYTNELHGLLTNADKVAVITSVTAASSFIAWSDQFEPDFDLIRTALKRPCARVEGDYTQPFAIPIPNFVAIRVLAQTLAQRTKCYLLLGQPEKALGELTLLNNSRRIMEHAPTGKPMTLVAAMINVAIAGLYVDTIANGLEKNGWQEPQLAAIQEQLKEMNLTPFVVEALKEGPAAMCHAIETTKANDFEGLFIIVPRTNLWQKLNSPLFVFFTFAPRGWVYQNMVAVADLEQTPMDSYDLAHNLILPNKQAVYADKVGSMASHPSLFNFIAAMAVPNLMRATQTLAYNQTLVNEGQIVCALER